MCAIKYSVSAIFRVSCFILCLVGASRQVTISEFAVPKSIKMGESAELQCQYQLGVGEVLSEFHVKWWWQQLGAAANPVLIYQRMLKQRPWHNFTNIEIKDNDTLLLKDLLPKHSGTYKCEVSANYNEADKKQDMVVYTSGSGPVMNISEVADGPDEDDDDDVQVRCQAAGVAPRPDLVITLNGMEIPDCEEETTELPDGLFDIAANATLSKADALGGLIRCELFYDDSNITHEAFYVDHTYEELGAAAASAAPASEGSPAAVESTTEPPGNAGVAWSLAWGLMAPAALLTAVPAVVIFT